MSKLLTLYNLDPASSTYGYGDRDVWGWRIKDFANGTHQGGVHALSIAIKLDLLAESEVGHQAIDAAIRAIPKIRAPNGSLAESYPFESSFCVTALVAFDCLSAISVLQDQLPQSLFDEYLTHIEPLVSFITENDEKHGVISNHLATAVAAVFRWNRLTGSSLSRGANLLRVILDNQSSEGWFKEYEAADPGYQTLCTYYLAEAYSEAPSDELRLSLVKSAEFLKHFVHPDNTIGGLYGSRNTEVYYPAGVVQLSSLVPDFALIANRLERGVEDGHQILPENIDMGNYIPLLNAYAVAALHYKNSAPDIASAAAPIPCEEILEKDFTETGIFLKSTPSYFAVVNYKKGGVLKVFDKETKQLATEDGGWHGRLNNGKRFATQQFTAEASFSDHEARASFYRVNEAYPTPIDFVMVRSLSQTLFRSLFLGNLFKKFLVWFLMTSKTRIPGSVLRQFEFGERTITVTDSVVPPPDTKKIERPGKFRAIHMPSSGYFMPQSPHYNAPRKIVNFELAGS